MNEKKSFKEKLRVAKENTDRWAENHPVLGYPVRHPIITNILTLILVMFVAGAVNGCSTADVPAENSSIVTGGGGYD